MLTSCAVACAPRAADESSHATCQLVYRVSIRPAIGLWSYGRVADDGTTRSEARPLQGGRCLGVGYRPLDGQGECDSTGDILDPDLLLAELAAIEVGVRLVFIDCVPVPFGVLGDG